MTPFRLPRLTLGLLLAVLSVALTAHGQPVGAPVPVLPGGKKAKGKEKDDRDWTEAIHLPVLREAKSKIEAVNKYLDGKDPLWGTFSCPYDDLSSTRVREALLSRDCATLRSHLHLLEAA